MDSLGDTSKLILALPNGSPPWVIESTSNHALTTNPNDQTRDVEGTVLLESPETAVKPHH